MTESRMPTVVAALVTLLLLTCCLTTWLGPLAEPVLVMAFGWALFLRRVIPEAQLSTAGLITFVACLSGFTLGLHRLILRWRPSRADEASSVGTTGRTQTISWSLRQTATVAGAFVFLFVAGISFVGLTHEVAWLFKSEQPFWDPSSLGIASTRAHDRNNQKQHGIALLSDHIEPAQLPHGGLFTEDGRPLHSTWAALLPYLDQAPMYAQIDLQIPWNDPRHKEIFETRIDAFENPLVTRLQGVGVISKRPADMQPAPVHYAWNQRLMRAGKRRTLEEITDGASQTIASGNVNTRIRAWGDPISWRDPAIGINRSPAGFGSPFPGGANFLFVDGSVRFLSDDIDPAVLKALSTPDADDKIDESQDW